MLRQFIQLNFMAHEITRVFKKANIISNCIVDSYVLLITAQVCVKNQNCKLRILSNFIFCKRINTITTDTE